MSLLAVCFKADGVNARSRSRQGCVPAIGMADHCDEFRLDQPAINASRLHLLIDVAQHAQDVLWALDGGPPQLILRVKVFLVFRSDHDKAISSQVFRQPGISASTDRKAWGQNHQRVRSTSKIGKPIPDCLSGG